MGDNMRVIPIKNYLITGLIIIATTLIVLFLVDYYENSKKYAVNDRMDILNIIDEKSIENYIVENHEVIIYMSNSSDETIYEYEETLRAMIIDRDYEKTIVYFDTKNVGESFYDDFVTKYFSSELINNNIALNITPNLLIVIDGKVSKILYVDGQEFKASDLIRFVDNNI